MITPHKTTKVFETNAVKIQKRYECAKHTLSCPVIVNGEITEDKWKLILEKERAYRRSKMTGTTRKS